jgi:hypothetical protein
VSNIGIEWMLDTGAGLVGSLVVGTLDVLLGTTPLDNSDLVVTPSTANSNNTVIQTASLVGAFVVAKRLPVMFGRAGIMIGVPGARGYATQAQTVAALAAREQVKNGATLYRVGTMGKSHASEAQFWALEHPSTPGFAARYGIPPENVVKADFVETAVMRPGAPFVVTHAVGVPGAPGGGLEVVVAPGSVVLKSFVTGGGW